MRITSTPIRLVATMAAIALLVIEAACSSSGPSGQIPAGNIDSASGLVARSATVDLGRVAFDVQVEGRFELVNTDARPVRLTATPLVKMLEGC